MNITIGEEVYNSVLNRTGIVKEVGRQWVVVRSNTGATEQWIKTNCEMVD